MIGPQNLCTDINPDAAAGTLETARCNNVHPRSVITELVKGLLPRLKEKVAFLVFSPPLSCDSTQRGGKSPNRSSLNWWQKWLRSHGQILSTSISPPFPRRMILFNYHKRK
ncbi:hypothetical protein H1C71_000338 [Ictidomys tridecemlineatus]|nr:hypothetical protein H1C71_000338 [Ictidomys tridecemlineatus]